MIQDKTANTDHPVNELIANRWSPLAFDNEKLVSPESVASLLEAARWAPSSYNEQPWSYVVGIKGDETHAKLAEVLMDGNAWAREVQVLMLSVASLQFSRNQKPNRHAMHDVGCASGYMFLQATDMGIAMHEMAGFDVGKARESFEIGETHEPAAMIAIGYPGNMDALAADLKERDAAPRQRKEEEDMIWKAS